MIEHPDPSGERVPAGPIQGLRRWLPQGRSLPEELWRGRHRGILVLLWAHAAVIPIFALVRGYSLTHALLESLVVPATAGLASSSRLGRRARTGAASLGLLSSSAVLVHLSGGVIEMHFHFFVMVAVVALYQDWIPFLASVGYVFIHHGILGAIDATTVFNHPAAWNNPWKWAGIHAIFVLGTSAACLVTWRLNETALAQRTAAEERARGSQLASEAAQRRLSLLANVSRVLTSSLEVDEILLGVSVLVAPAVADHCVMYVREPDGSIRSIGPPPSGPHGACPDPEDENHPVMRAIQTSEPQLILDRDPAAIIVPLLARHEVLGAIAVSTGTSGRTLGEDDLPLIEELARRAAIAAENARLYARQRTVAETLQHSLLPERLPEVAGLATAARYIPGGPGVEIGGDWYDVIQLASGEVALAMGDVVGHGERAASLMGQLRNAVRAYALEGKSPVDVVERLNYMLCDLGTDGMATMIYGLMEPETGTLRFVNAGHPPPLVVGDGVATFLEETSGVPLGTLARARYTETVTTLSPGSTLLLYTDGLVEDRHMTLDEGMERLRAAALESLPDPNSLCDRVMERGVEGRDGQDDIAILALRLVPLGPHLTLELPRQPTVLAPLRATLRRWLTGGGVSDQEMYEILVAVGEACANAIQHAVGPAPSWFEVEGMLGDEVTISVRDKGRWRPPRTDGGGRGLQIMERFMDHVDLVREPAGTRVTMRRRLASVQGASR